jgi:hypothetical protein
MARATAPARFRSRRLPASLFPLLLAVAPLPAAAGPAEVTIYRCIDAKGRLTLRDTPCAKGERQETRSMLRPKDAPPRRAPAREARPAPEALPPTRVVVAYPARPMYVCVTPDGERYTSDSPEGNPRWVPLWTLGYPVLPAFPRRASGFDFRIGNDVARLRGGQRVVSGAVLPPAAYGAGTWIRDRCHPLPAAEVCARLVDRRDEIRRRFFNAMPSERDVLRVEERGINARLDEDCR